MFEWRKNNNSTLKVFIPGWATDSSLLPLPSTASLTHDWLLINSYDPLTLIPQLVSVLHQTPYSQIHLIGFSMGAHIAMECSPRLKRVHTLMLIGFIPTYGAKTIAGIRKLLRQNQLSYLKQFYKACFYDPKDYQVFEETLEPALLHHLSETLLESGLDYLESRQVSFDAPRTLPIQKIFHSEQDLIAPLAVAKPFWVNAHRPFNILPNTGHIPTFSDLITF